MMLLNVFSQQVDVGGFAIHSMALVVDQALESYPFRDDERQLITWVPETDFRFRGSDILMRHVLFNLIKNALRALAEADHGGIEIRLEPGEPVSRLIFRDTGIGIPPEIQDHLFEPFVTGSRGNGGTGIGLAFCRRVVESFEGSITCRTQRGSFTEFVVTLPTPSGLRPSC
jgi:two-component system CAI-1 autoinducer sensor kinase/phosphatase CqsS